MNTNLILKKLAVIWLVAAAFSGVAYAGGWQEGVNWSIGNFTGPDQLNCPEQYAATEPRAAFEGGRAALMRRAIESAKAGNYAYAFRLTLITQCHKPASRRYSRAWANKRSATICGLASRAIRKTYTRCEAGVFRTGRHAGWWRSGQPYTCASNCALNEVHP